VAKNNMNEEIFIYNLSNDLSKIEESANILEIIL